MDWSNILSATESDPSLHQQSTYAQFVGALGHGSRSTSPVGPRVRGGARTTAQGLSFPLTSSENIQKSRSLFSEMKSWQSENLKNLPTTLHTSSLEINTLELLRKLLDRVEIDESGCWVFRGKRCPSHGQLHLGYNRYIAAYRIAWKLYHQKAIQFQINHKCLNCFCVNPLHLYEGTKGENELDKGFHARLIKTGVPL